jgi:hypothetical protein
LEAGKTLRFVRRLDAYPEVVIQHSLYIEGF